MKSISKIVLLTLSTVCFVVTISAAQVDVDRLFHANPPTLAPNANQPAAASPQKPAATAQQDPSMGLLGDIFDDDFNPYRGSRHDEFDFALTKVKITQKSN